MRVSILMIATLLSVLPFVASAETEQQAVDRYRRRIEDTLGKIGTPGRICPGCELFTAGSSRSIPPECRRTYRDFYKIKDRIQDETAADQDIDVRFSFGYIDSGRAVYDRYMISAYLAEIKSPCAPGRNACGFSPAPDDATLYTKSIQVLGPDGKPRVRRIKMRVLHSSVTGDERENRGPRAAEQEKRTSRVLSHFKQGLQSADMVLYVGHARGGGGPDFGPPQINANRRTDYQWYRANKPGLKMLTETLAATPTPPKILGIFACYAQDLFHKPLKAAAPNTGILMSGTAEFESALGQATATLDSVLGFKCDPEFSRSISVIKKIDGIRTLPEGFDVTPVRIDGVFRR